MGPSVACAKPIPVEVLDEPLLLTGCLSRLIMTAMQPWCQCVMHQWRALDLGFCLVPHLQAGMACGQSYSIRSELVVLMVMLTSFVMSERGVIARKAPAQPVTPRCACVLISVYVCFRML